MRICWKGQLIPDGRGSRQGKSRRLTPPAGFVPWISKAPRARSDELERLHGSPPYPTPPARFHASEKLVELITTSAMASTPHSHRSPSPSAPVVIGILGGIASGKSEVARLLAAPGGVVIDADELATAVLCTPETKRWLREEFGAEVLGERGEPDREALSRRVFGDDRARERLEGWIHPRVRERISASLNEARTAGCSPIVLDIPLLLENDARLLLENDAREGLAGECDFLVFVETDPEGRDRRAQERRGWPPGEVARRERLQLPLSRKRERARHVIENRAGLAELATRVREVLEAENLLP